MFVGSVAAVPLYLGFFSAFGGLTELDRTAIVGVAIASVVAGSVVGHNLWRRANSNGRNHGPRRA